MIAGLQKIDSVAADKINDPVFLSETARPNAGRQIFERLWFPKAALWIAKNGFDKREDAERNIPVCFHPIFKVLDELRLKNRITIYAAQDLPRGAVLQP